MSGPFIRKLEKVFSKIKKLFQRQKEQPVAKEIFDSPPTKSTSPLPEQQVSITTTLAHVPIVSIRPKRLWNIGLDFGTAYTKCIVRNLATEEAFIVPLHGDDYLLPTEVFYGGNSLRLHGDESNEESSTKVLHLKMALVEISSGCMNGRWVEEFMRITESSDGDGVPGHIEALTVYFLARVIQRAQAFILTKSPDFSETHEDRWMVNMAVPVAHAQEVRVSKSFQRCLNWAFLLTRETDLSRLSAEEIQTALVKVGEPPEQDIGCYLYPEVSANVQTYIRSHGVDGLYLFVDVGAGTVDLSVFIYYQHPDNNRPLSYPSAGVIPLGSSQIEMRVARKLNGNRQEPMAGLQEIVRRVKEGDGNHDETINQEIRVIEKEIENEMFIETAPVLKAGSDRIIPHQWRSLKMLLSGGGAATPLYQNAVNRWFEQVNFFVPEVRPIPLPSDLQWPADIPESRRERLFRRFSVAYGLSFDRANLDDHRFPQDMPPLPIEPDAPPERPQAPRQEDC